MCDGDKGCDCCRVIGPDGNNYGRDYDQHKGADLSDLPPDEELLDWIMMRIKKIEHGGLK